MDSISTVKVECEYDRHVAPLGILENGYADVQRAAIGQGVAQPAFFQPVHHLREFSRLRLCALLLTDNLAKGVEQRRSPI